MFLAGEATFLRTRVVERQEDLAVARFRCIELANDKSLGLCRARSTEQAFTKGVASAAEPPIPAAGQRSPDGRPRGFLFDHQLTIESFDHERVFPEFPKMQ